MTYDFKLYNKRGRLKRQDLINEYKTPCVKCGESRKYVIDWHHINPFDKKFEISKGAKERGIQQIIDELHKCVCLCRNCHAEFHHFYGSEATASDFDEYIHRGGIYQ